MPQVGFMPQNNTTIAQPQPTVPIQNGLSNINQLGPAQNAGQQLGQMPPLSQANPGVNGFAQNGMQNLGPLPPPPSMEQSALAGDNKQQISNFMNALNQVGAGNNNTFMNQQSANMPAVNNLVNPNIAGQSNATTGNQTYMPAQAAMPGTQFGNPQQFLQPGAPQNPLQQLPGSSMNQNGIAPAFGPPAQQPASMPGMAANPNINLMNQPLVSDENLKTDITNAKDDVTDFLSKINAHSYKYKQPELDGAGTYVSPMAQELESTELGKSAVIETPRGKMVDYARLGGINLAAAAVLQKQINQLRTQFKIKGK